MSSLLELAGGMTVEVQHYDKGGARLVVHDERKDLVLSAELTKLELQALQVRMMTPAQRSRFKAELAARAALGQPPAAAPVKRGRNEPCHCGSGKKFKHCHGGIH